MPSNFSLPFFLTLFLDINILPLVKSESYHQARNNAVKDLAEAVNQVKVLKQRIARLKQTIASLDALIEGEEPICTETKPDTPLSLREACREALKIANGPRTAT